MAYLLPAEVSFSIWFFYFVNKVQFVAADASGAIDPYMRVAESQYAGAFVAFALITLHLRRWFRRVSWNQLRTLWRVSS